jgi:hypothetical protein
MPSLTVTAWSAAAVIAAAAALLVTHRRLKRAATATAGGGRPWDPPPHVPARERSEYWEPTAPDPLARRQSFRRAGGPTLVRLAAPGGPAVLGCVLDRSAAGLGLRVERAIPPGAAVRLLPCDAPAGTAPAEATVRWCRPAGAASELGCQFTATPPPGVLLLFG